MQRSGLRDNDSSFAGRLGNSIRCEAFDQNTGKLGLITSQEIVKRIPCMLMCIGCDTIDKDDKLTSYPELCHGERICCVEEFLLFCRSDRRQKRERICFIPTLPL